MTRSRPASVVAAARNRSTLSAQAVRRAGAASGRVGRPCEAGGPDRAMAGGTAPGGTAGMVGGPAPGGAGLPFGVYVT